jgi:hypothetical protein
MLNKDNFQTSFTSVYLRKKVLHGLLIYKKKNITNLLFDNVKVCEIFEIIFYTRCCSHSKRKLILFLRMESVTGAIEPQQEFFRPVKKMINFPKCISDEL